MTTPETSIRESLLSNGDSNLGLNSTDTTNNQIEGKQNPQNHKKNFPNFFFKQPLIFIRFKLNQKSQKIRKNKIFSKIQ